MVISVGSVEPTIKPDGREQEGEKRKTLPRWLLILGWSFTTLIAFSVAAISLEQYSAQQNQIAALQGLLLLVKSPV